MGMIRKAVLGSLVLGAGAIALTRNKKTVVKIGKDVTKEAKKMVRNGSKRLKSLKLN